MKTRVLLLFFGLLAILYSTEAQKNILELAMKGGKAQNVFSVTDSYSNIAYVFQGSKSIQITVLSPDYQIQKEFLIDRDEAEKKNKVIGAAMNESAISIYLYDERERNLASLTIDRQTGAHTFSASIGTIQKNEYLLKSFDMEGKFYMMVVPHQKNVVLLYESSNGSNFLIKNYEIGYPTFYAKLSSKNDELNQKTDVPVGIEKISYAIENNIKSSYPSKKLYTYGNRIYMTFEEPAHTHLVIIDPASTSAIYRKLNFTLDKNRDTNPKQGNSFLYLGDLFRVTLSNDQLNLIVITLDSMKMLKNYNIYPEQPIPILNGVIKQDGNDIGDRIIKSTQVYFKKIQKGKLAIAVNELPGSNYEIEVGAYEEVTTYRNTGPAGYPVSPNMSIGFGMGMGPMMMGYGGYPGGFYDPYYMGYPGYYPYGGTVSSTSIRATYFQSLLEVQDLSHIEGNVPTTLREKMNDYEEASFKNNTPEMLTITPARQQATVLGYYSKSRNKYMLVEFSR